MKTKLLRKLRKGYQIVLREDNKWLLQQMKGKKLVREFYFKSLSDCLWFFHVIIKSHIKEMIPEFKNYKKIIKF